MKSGRVVNQLFQTIFLTMLLFLHDAAIFANQPTGELIVTVRYDEQADILRMNHAEIRLQLLDDRADLLAQIEALRQQSKAELEPVIKAYMYAAGALTRLASQNSPEQQSQQEQLSRTFKASEQQLYAILARYRESIRTIMQRDMVQTHALSASTGTISLKKLASGSYRVFVIATFATTRLIWFESVTIKGGDRLRIELTRNNLKNPYWTDLNWWSFINLDFSKHH